METAILRSAEILKSITPSEKEEFDSNMNQNLYTHIKELLKTKNALNDNEKFDDLFEDISLRIKKLGYYLKDDDDLSSDYIQKLLKEPQVVEAIKSQFNKEKALLKPPSKVEEGSEPQPITNINFIPDYYELFQKFDSFGEKEYRFYIEFIANAILVIICIFIIKNTNVFTGSNIFSWIIKTTTNRT